MRTFFNTLFHGDGKTRLLLWGCVAAVAAAIAFLVVFVLTLNLPWLIATVIAILTPLVIMRLYDFNDQKNDETPKPVKEGDAYEDNSKVSKKTEKEPEKADEKSVKDTQKPEPQHKGSGKISERFLEEPDKGLRKLREEESKATESHNKSESVTEKEGQIREKTGDGNSEEPAQNQEIPQKGQKSPSQKLVEVDNRGLKQLMHKYKVKREHKPVMIDSSRHYGIEHCPAYMWVTRGTVHFLLMEATPREISIDKSKLAEVVFSKDRGDGGQEYALLRTNALMQQIFGDLVPTYREEVVDRHRVTVKNLYALGGDIKLTNTSARAAFDLLQSKFVVPEKYELTGRVGDYTKEAYKIKLLWQDGVINTTEFKARTKALLQSMAEAKISALEYDKNLREMVERQLITREYADYFADVRK